MLLKAYADAASIPYPIKSWDFFIAFSMFRLSVIIQGIAARSERGLASSESASLLADALPTILDDFSRMWWGVIDKADGKAEACKL